MTINILEKLNDAVKLLINQERFLETVERLSEEIRHSHEPFVWSVINPNSTGGELPDVIKSSWVFVLKKDVRSGCHYHPNSIQHMVLIKGQGQSKVGGTIKRMARFESATDSLTDIWYVIDKGVPHEFFPERDDMVVISFHTCEANELEEISCESGEKRLYEA